MVDQEAAGSWLNTSTVVTTAGEELARLLIKTTNAKTVEHAGTLLLKT
jgi:hypothetical protein